jgi:hypothetical protein
VPAGICWSWLHCNYLQVKHFHLYGCWATKVFISGVECLGIVWVGKNLPHQNVRTPMRLFKHVMASSSGSSQSSSTVDSLPSVSEVESNTFSTLRAMLSYTPSVLHCIHLEAILNSSHLGCLVYTTPPHESPISYAHYHPQSVPGPAQSNSMTHYAPITHTALKTADTTILQMMQNNPYLLYVQFPYCKVH